VSSTDASGLALRLARIDKRFGELQAVRRGELEVRTRLIHAVVGENGAGKSTLLKIAAGIIAADGGDVWVGGELQASYDARRAQTLGVAMVQQHFALFGSLSALENIMLGAEETRGAGFLDRARGRSRAEGVLASLGVELDLDRKVATFGVGDKQRLEIARALYRDARVVILDEPTAVLTPLESTALYATLRRLADDGRAVVVVTHHLDEVEAHADVVTVMRRGETLGTRAVERGTAAVGLLAAEIVGGEPLPELHAQHEPSARPRVEGQPALVKLEVKGLTLGRALRGVSLEVLAGEIVGVAGVLGNGQSELALVLGGLAVPDDGEVLAGAIEVVHEDRQTAGLVLDATVAENLALGDLTRFTRRGLIDDDALATSARERIARFDIRPPDPGALARALSGGNQQKIVLARALAREPAVLVVAHPTRGVDLVAARAIHQQILAAAARGTAVLVIGADLGELRLLCDRILVMLRGRVVASLPPTADDATLGAAMLGREAAA
jgi:simple sugar transport system ATP-binding protein